MSKILFTDNASSQPTGDIATNDTSIMLVSGAKFPDIVDVGEEVFYVTIDGTAGGQGVENARVTNRVGNAIGLSDPIQNNFTAATTVIELRLNAVTMDRLLQVQEATTPQPGDLFSLTALGTLSPIRIKREIFTGDNVQLDFQAASNVDDVPSGYSVSVSGVLQRDGTDYTVVNKDIIRFTTAPHIGDEIDLEYMEAF